MVLDVAEAFTGKNLDMAREIIKEMILLMTYLIRFLEVANILRETTEHVDQCVDILMIAKYFERIGDHAVNI